MQIYLTSIRRGKKSLKVFVATLCYPRASYVKFFNNERAESWQQGLREAFDYFGGIPQEVLCDNAKSLIIERDAYAECSGQLKLAPTLTAYGAAALIHLALTHRYTSGALHRYSNR